MKKHEKNTQFLLSSLIILSFALDYWKSLLLIVATIVTLFLGGFPGIVFSILVGFAIFARGILYSSPGWRFSALLFGIQLSLVAIIIFTSNNLVDNTVWFITSSIAKVMMVVQVVAYFFIKASKVEKDTIGRLA